MFLDTVEDNRMDETQVIKFEIGAKYILIVRQSMTEEDKTKLIKSLNEFMNDDHQSVLVLVELDCTLEKITEEKPIIYGNVEMP